MLLLLLIPTSDCDTPTSDTPRMTSRPQTSHTARTKVQAARGRSQRALACTLCVPALKHVIISCPCAGSQALVRRRPASMHALGVGLGVLDLSVAQQLERSNVVYKISTSSSGKVVQRMAPVRRPSAHSEWCQSAPVCASCARVR